MYKGRQRKAPVVQGMASDLGCLEKRWGRPPWRGKFGPGGEGLECQAEELRRKDSPGGRGSEPRSQLCKGHAGVSLWSSAFRKVLLILLRQQPCRSACLSCEPVLAGSAGSFRCAWQAFPGRPGQWVGIWCGWLAMGESSCLHCPKRSVRCAKWVCRPPARSPESCAGVRAGGGRAEV